MRDDDLDALLAAARTQPPEPNAAFLHRLEQAALSEAQAMFAPRTPPIQRSPWAWLSAALGGWPGLAGLGTAALAGLVIGITPALGPDLLAALTDGGEAWLVDPLPGLETQLSFLVED